MDINLGDKLEDPSRSFNGDETLMWISNGIDKVLAMMGTQDVYVVHKSSLKLGIAVLQTVSASRWILPQSIVYPYERI